jgi:hypothetical protein
LTALAALHKGYRLRWSARQDEPEKVFTRALGVEIPATRPT